MLVKNCYRQPAFQVGMTWNANYRASLKTGV